MAKREGRPRVLSLSRHGPSLLHLLPDAASLVKHTWPTTPGFRIRSGTTGEGQGTPSHAVELLGGLGEERGLFVLAEVRDDFRVGVDDFVVGAE